MKRSCLPIVLSLLALPACSRTVSIAPTPPLQANLAQPCQQLAAPPEPLIDPDRAGWEAELLAAYADCAARHLATVRSWPAE